MNLTTFKLKANNKGARAFVLLLLFFTSISANAQNKNAAISTYLQQLIEKQELTPQDISDWTIKDQHISRLSKVEHIYFRQLYKGIEVNKANASIHIMPDGDILSKDHQFVKDLENKVSGPSIPMLTAIEAVEAVSQQLGYNITEKISVVDNIGGIDREVLLSDGGVSLSEIPVKLIYQMNQFGQIVLAWDLSIEEVGQQNWWSFKVDASTGNIIDKVSWMVSCGYDNNHDHAKNEKCTDDHSHNESNNNAASFNSMVGGYNVYPMPIETPNHGPRSLVNDPDNAIASPFGWHDTDGVAGPEYTITRGNNAHAYDDGDNSGFSPDGGGSLVFDFPINLNYSPGDPSEEAAITNLFYWNNIIHDLTYLYGFDESSGNFQSNNYGNGGLGGDWVRAEAQDGSGSCNANMFTPPDGSLPRMQMYVCSNRDGDLDNMVIVHEYAHGISNRLTGGGNNSSCLNNQEQMGEGWSDWYGLVMTMQDDDLSTDTRGVGTWLFGQGANGPGIREFPYTTDMGVNSHTYDRIKTAAVPHGVGSVWSAMLWEVTWALIDQYGFDTDFYNGTGGNNMAIALVTEGMKLQPCNPGFVDGRDAILDADVALYGGANQCLIWTAFAKRGLGLSADQGSPFSRSDGTEAFDVPGGSVFACPPSLGLGCNDPVPAGATTEAEFLAQGGSLPSGICGGGGPSTISFQDVVSGDICSGITTTRSYTVVQDVDVFQCVQTITNSANPPTIISCAPDQTITCSDEAIPEPNLVIANTDCALNSSIMVSSPVFSGLMDCPGSTISYTYTVIDDCGETASCVQVFTIENEGPIITSCPADGTASCSADVVPDLNGVVAVTACGLGFTTEVSSPVINGQNDCSGTTYTYIYTVSDACGRTTTCEQVITIQNNAPEITSCPVDQTIACIEDAVIDPNAIIVVTACDMGYVSYATQPDVEGAANCPGTTYTYTYKAIDDCGRVAECQQIFTIDNAAPVVTVIPGETVNCYEDIIVSNDDATVTTSCGEDYELKILPPALEGEHECPGTTYTYAFRVRDNCGREVIANRIFTIGNNAPPTIVSPPDMTVGCDWNFNLNPDYATVTTGCTLGYITTVTGPTTTGSANCPGATYTYTYTVTDDCGRTASDTRKFTIANTAPVFLNCPSVPLQLNCEDEGWQQVIQAWLASVQAESSCSNVINVTNNYNPNSQGLCINNGTRIVRFFATDACGRTSTCEGMVIVADTEPPLFVEAPQDELVVCNYITQDKLDAWVDAHGYAEVEDCWANVNWSTFPNNPTINCGGNPGPTSITVTFVATDGCGNKASMDATFTALPAMGGIGGSTEDIAEESMQLFQNQPNPFSDETSISFYLPQGGKAALSIYDVSGKLLKEINGEYSKGLNVESINRSDLQGAGMLYYKLSTATETATQRMILLD